jgi:hypothetical protein
LTSLDGPSLLAAIQSRRIIYQDETGVLYYSESPGRHWIGAVLEQPIHLSTIKHFKSIIAALSEELKSKGISELYTVVSSVRRFRFAELFGFETNLEVINNQYEVMRKELL